MVYINLIYLINNMIMILYWMNNYYLMIISYNIEFFDVYLYLVIVKINQINFICYQII